MKVAATTIHLNLNPWLASTAMTQASNPQATGDVQVVGAPQSTTPASTTTVAPGGTPLTPSTGTSTTPAGPAPNPIIQFAPFVLILGVFIVMSMLAGRKEKKKQAAMMNSIKKQDLVMTGSGIIGTVVEVSDDEIVLRVEDGRIRFAKRSVTQVLKSAAGGGGTTVVEAKSVAKEEREAVRA